MVDKITQSLTNKIRNKIPEIDDERAEIINYGLQLLLGEVPKFFIMFFIAYILGVFKLSLITFLILLPYRVASGGFHLKTHIGCIISTCTFYCGVAFLSKSIILDDIVKYFFIIAVGVFGIIMIKLYAPADTENVPILSHNERRKKQMLSYFFFIGGLLISIFIKNSIVSNMIIFGYLAQTCMITRFAYKITNNKYGYEICQNG